MLWYQTREIIYFESCDEENVPEPLVRGTDETREVVLDVLNVVQLGREGVVDVNDDDLPVGLALIKESHDTKDLDLLDLADIADLFTDLTDIKRVVVTVSLGLRMHMGRVLPGLMCRSTTSCVLSREQLTCGRAP